MSYVFAPTCLSLDSGSYEINSALCLVTDCGVQVHQALASSRCTVKIKCITFLQEFVLGTDQT